MYERGESLDGIERHVHKLQAYPKVNSAEAIPDLIRFCKEVDPKAPYHYDVIEIDSKISLWIPGKYDNKYPGDYLLTWNGNPPEHGDVCQALIRNVMEYPEAEQKAAYQHWLTLLEDVYENGTKNMDSYPSERDQFAVQLIFWITLQEDINKPDKMGRQRPLCRYAEALATTQNGFEHSYEEVEARLEETDPVMLDEWNIPSAPKFYKWRAF